MKKFLKYILIGIAALIIVSVLGLVVWSITRTYPAGDLAKSALISTDTVSITQDEWIMFEPAQQVQTGLIFYPGGLVEPAAYAPILHKIAEEGILVIITPMPLNLAIMNTNAANAVIEAYPFISKWILAGHSLGGASASIYVENNPNEVDVIALWDSYPADSADLSDNDIQAISIYGTMNSIPNTENFNEKRHLLPLNTIFIGVEGASHAQFGDYGPQKGDVVAIISMAEQHDEVAEIMLDFIDP
ncbi:alpha/beta hydrolase [Chloroflexota bacterium]